MKSFYTAHQQPRKNTRTKDKHTRLGITACLRNLRYNLYMNKIYRQPTKLHCNGKCHIMKNTTGNIISEKGKHNLSNNKTNNQIKTYPSNNKLHKRLQVLTSKSVIMQRQGVTGHILLTSKYVYNRTYIRAICSRIAIGRKQGKKPVYATLGTVPMRMFYIQKKMNTQNIRIHIRLIRGYHIRVNRIRRNVISTPSAASTKIKEQRKLFQIRRITMYNMHGGMKENDTIIENSINSNKINMSHNDIFESKQRVAQNAIKGKLHENERINIKDRNSKTQRFVAVTKESNNTSEGGESRYQSILRIKSLGKAKTNKEVLLLDNSVQRNRSTSCKKQNYTTEPKRTHPKRTSDTRERYSQSINSTRFVCKTHTLQFVIHIQGIWSCVARIKVIAAELIFHVRFRSLARSAVCKDVRHLHWVHVKVTHYTLRAQHKEYQDKVTKRAKLLDAHSGTITIVQVPKVHRKQNKTTFVWKATIRQGLCLAMKRIPLVLSLIVAILNRGIRMRVDNRGHIPLGTQYLIISPIASFHNRNLINNDQDNWKDFLSSVAYVYNNTVNIITGYTPLENCHKRQQSFTMYVFGINMSPAAWRQQTEIQYEMENENLAPERVTTLQSAGETRTSAPIMIGSQITMITTTHEWMVGATISQRYNHVGKVTATRGWNRKDARQHYKMMHCHGCKPEGQSDSTIDESKGHNPTTRETSTTRESHTIGQSLKSLPTSGGHTKLHH